MKKYLIFAFTAIVSLSGCVKEKDTAVSENQVSFSAASGALETRTSYGDEYDYRELGSIGYYTKTFVNWENGDEVTILSTYSDGYSDGSHPPVNYTIYNEVDGNAPSGAQATISNAKISPTTGQQDDVIEWGAGTNVFYGMYPKSGTVPGSSLSLQEGVPTMTCVIPATWSPNADELDELPYGYMFAKESTTRKPSVTLTFNPKFTAFCFTLKNDDTVNSIPLSSLTLSSESQALNGTFAVSTSDGTVSVTTPDASNNNTTVLDANKSVTVTFPYGFSIPKKENGVPGSKTFTVVVLPTAYPKPQENSQAVDKFTNLTVTVTQVTEQNAVSKRLKLGKNVTLNDPSTYKAISFDAGKKHNISVTLPDFTSYDYEFSVINPTDLTYAGGTAHATIVSTKTPAGGSAQSASWTVEGYYTDAECTEEASGYTSFLPNGIDSGSGGGNGNISFSYEAATPSAVSSNYQSVAEADIAASNFGSGSSTSKYLNLSNPTNMESDYIRESANSYIVNGTGFYKIPLVMGNGVRFNSKNTNAYSGTNFVNYKGNTVSSTGPYLHNTGSNPVSAYVVWEDVSGLIEADASYDLAGTPIVEGSNGVYWLRFHVKQAKQGNAVIAVTDGTNVMWSYHIWVTNYIPQNYPGYNNYDSYPGNGPHKIMPVNLGWIYANNITATGNMYPGECIYAKLVQSGSGSIAIMKIDRPRHSEVYAATTFANNQANPTGSSPYYQWGRKDPLLPALNGSNVTSFGKVTGLNTINNSGATIATGISNPGKFITGSAINNSYWWGAYNASDNKSDLWNLESSNYSTSVKKTIYDPCPASYCMPSQNLFDPTYEGNQYSVSTLYYLQSGVQDKSSKVYHYNLGQRSYSSGSIANASTTPSSTANVTGFYYLATSSMKTWGTYSIRCPYLFYFRNYGYQDSYTVNKTDYLSTAGFSVRPMQDPTFDPADDGVLGSGTGPSINWQN